MQRTEQILRGALEALAAGDTEGFASFVADDMIVNFPGRSPLAGQLRGRGVFASRIRALTGGTLSVEPIDVLGSPDRAVGVYRMRIQCGDRSFAWRHINVYRVEGDQLVEAWAHPFDQHGLDGYITELSSLKDKSQ